MDSNLDSLDHERSAHRLTRQVPRPLALAFAIVAFFHFTLLIAGTYKTTYDAYVHIFFADHYQRGWFSTWEPRWYTGFATVSYPPGTHQLLAVIGSVVGLQWAFVLISTAAMTGIVIGTFRSAQIWVSREAAAYAALLAALSSSLAETLHVFGQLPTLVALAFALNGLPSAERWVRTGRWSALWTALAFTAATTAVHHVTTLFGVVFIVAPVLARPMLDSLREPAPGEPVNRRVSPSAPTASAALLVRRALPTVVRAGVYLTAVLMILITVVLPYWMYSRSDPIAQIPIPHGSRDNFIANPNSGMMFFVIPWGVLLVAFPYALVRGMLGRAWPLMGSVAILTLLGTGGTTPIPRLMLRGAFDILTLDRFTFWATILILPLAGQFVVSLRSGGTRAALNRNFGVRTTRVMVAALAVTFVVFTMTAASLGQLQNIQPDEVAMDPIVSFLQQDRHDQWRYLTLGFGDQMAWLSAQTTAETVDGNYHSARRLPELTSRPVERLEGAKFTGVAGLGSLQQFLTNPEKFHLKFVFSNDKFYDPLLWASGWQELEPLENGIHVWQRDDVTPLPPDRISFELPRWQRLMWGTLPPVSMLAGLFAGLMLASGVTTLADQPSRRVRRRGWAGRLYSPVDRRLRRHAAQLPRSKRAGTARWGRRWTRSPRPVEPAVMKLQRALVIVVAAALPVGWAAYRLGSDDLTPAEVVYSYYDALDLREVNRAYSLIDPESVSSFDQYLAEYRRTSGLVSSFARLESMSLAEQMVKGDAAMVSTTLNYLTPFERFTVDVHSQLRLVDGHWLIDYTPIDFTIPPEPFGQLPAVEYVTQGRRQPTDGLTDPQDVLDRPRLNSSRASLISVDGELSVTGEVTNIDAIPAYLTVRATLFDTQGNKLASQSNGPGTKYTLLPQETVPFRIDFEGVAGTDGVQDMTFDPEGRPRLGIDPSSVGSVQVTIQSLANSFDLNRNAEFVDVTRGPDEVAFELFNSGVTEITIAQTFVTLYSDQGAVWVVNGYSPRSITPRRSQPQRIELPSPQSIRPVPVAIDQVINNVPVDRYVTSGEPITTWTDTRLSAMTFFRTVG